MPYCADPSGGSGRIQRRAGIAQGLLPTVEGDRRTERLQQVVEGLQFRIVAAEFRFQQPDFLPVLDAFDEAFRNGSTSGLRDRRGRCRRRPISGTASRGSGRPTSMGPAQESVVILGGGVTSSNRSPRPAPTRCRCSGIPTNGRRKKGGRQPLAAALDDVVCSIRPKMLAHMS